MNIKKCVIPIAGRGARRYPITKTVSKEMLPILNKPSILLIVEECLKSGIEEIIFVLNKNNYELIKNFFSKDEELMNFAKNQEQQEILKKLEEIITKIKFHYVLQDENIRGTGGAIYAARDYIDDEYFGVIFGDDLIDSEESSLQKLINECLKNECNVIGVKEIPESLKKYYYAIKYKKDNIMEGFAKNDSEKLLASNHMMIGRLVLHRKVLDKIFDCKVHENNEYYISDVLELISEEIRTVECLGDYYNIGNKNEYLKANIAYYLKEEKNGEELIEFIKRKMD